MGLMGNRIRTTEIFLIKMTVEAGKNKSEIGKRLFNNFTIEDMELTSYCDSQKYHYGLVS